MKNIIVFLIMTVPAIASPFWNHPNVAAATPAPFNGEYYTLDLLQLQNQSPQNGIFYTGGVVGYFANEWRLPIWTTPVVIPPVELPWVFEDQHNGRPVAPPVVVPPHVIPPSGPNPPGGNPPFTPPPFVPKPNDPFCPPSGSDIPEPSTYVMIGAGLVGLAVYRRRREYKR